MPIALEFRDVCKRYVAGAGACVASAAALRSVTLGVMQGESVAVVGDASAGKSTLLFCAAGLLAPDSGSVSWFGESRRGAGAARATYHFAEMRAAHRPPRRIRTEPHIHLIDRPESLGAAALARLSAWIERRLSRGDTVLVATRDTSVACALAHRSVMLRGGRAFHTTQPARAARVAERAAAVAPRSGTM